MNEVKNLKALYITYASTILPKSSISNLPIREHGDFRIASFNIHYFTDVFEKKDTYQNVLRDIQDIDANVIFLQEVIVGGIIQISKDLTLDVSDLFIKLKDMGYSIPVFCNSVPSWYYGIYGNMALIDESSMEFCKKQSICSDFNQTIYTFPKSEKVVTVSGNNEGSKETRCYIYLQFYQKSKVLHFFGTHLDVADENLRVRQMEKIIQDAAIFRNENDYVFILGDLNTFDREQYTNDESILNNPFTKNNGKVVKLLGSKGYFNMFTKPPLMTTWNNTTVDFIFCNKHIPDKYYYTNVYPTTSSDHLPVFVTLKKSFFDF
jgi:endonuclease/exonuclease/phosphatase family metal-dependent hydrolase